jgi:hypothetical protein
VHSCWKTEYVISPKDLHVLCKLYHEKKKIFESKFKDKIYIIITPLWQYLLGVQLFSGAFFVFFCFFVECSTITHTLKMSVKRPHDVLFLVFNATFSNISAISWWPVLVVGRGRSTRREPPTMGKQLVNFITCGCESSVPFL